MQLSEELQAAVDDGIASAFPLDYATREKDPILEKQFIWRLATTTSIRVWQSDSEPPFTQNHNWPEEGHILVGYGGATGCREYHCDTLAVVMACGTDEEDDNERESLRALGVYKGTNLELSLEFSSLEQEYGGEEGFEFDDECSRVFQALGWAFPAQKDWTYTQRDPHTLSETT